MELPAVAVMDAHCKERVLEGKNGDEGAKGMQVCKKTERAAVGERHYKRRAHLCTTFLSVFHTIAADHSNVTVMAGRVGLVRSVCCVQPPRSGPGQSAFWDRLTG